jgi:hypothetical protein
MVIPDFFSAQNKTFFLLKTVLYNLHWVFFFIATMRKSPHPLLPLPLPPLKEKHLSLADEDIY